MHATAVDVRFNSKCMAVTPVDSVKASVESRKRNECCLPLTFVGAASLAQYHRGIILPLHHITAVVAVRWVNIKMNLQRGSLLIVTLIVGLKVSRSSEVPGANMIKFIGFPYL